jgi:hypothetical protein
MAAYEDCRPGAMYAAALESMTMRPLSVTRRAAADNVSNAERRLVAKSASMASSVRSATFV